MHQSACNWASRICSNSANKYWKSAMLTSPVSSGNEQSVKFWSKVWRKSQNSTPLPVVSTLAIICVSCSVATWRPVANFRYQITHFVQLLTKIFITEVSQRLRQFILCNKTTSWYEHQHVAPLALAEIAHHRCQWLWKWVPQLPFVYDKSCVKQRWDREIIVIKRANYHTSLTVGTSPTKGHLLGRRFRYEIR